MNTTNQHDKKLRIGVIGTGAIGVDHIRRCTHTLSGAEIVAVSDVNIDNAKKAVTPHNPNAKAYESGHDVINAENVDAVMVTSWGPTHAEYVLSAIKAGKFVFCEKPLATTIEDCDKIIQAEQAHGSRLVQVGFMRPYDKDYRALRKMIVDGAIGTPLMVHAAHRNQNVGENYVTSMAIFDTLIHELDVLRWLLDDDYISAQVIFPRQTSHTHAKLRDPQIVLLETKSGVRIDVEVFVNCQYGYDIQCSVVGEKGIVSLPDPAAVALRSDAKLCTPILTDWKERFIDAYDIEIQEFIDGCKTGKIKGPSSWNGYVAAVAAEACVKAQETQAIEAISIPERPAMYK
ncbi:Predicted dehydrogenase (MviM) (PDB:3UUW) [Commensalibacter communis]|uniref:Inositol 2-dehydrogenase n=1 Tax=Commensalibacter communis TaxID=2972786 RepID=A0A9W4TRG2_9PROT|nr:Gfo/Idh/MocA family oxidoreductase [Commensalibacter communis]CAI3954857.1 Predicted dehydrogenase (MviM) (PDB:3UUW) [Commensalibacter communis]CAI3956086.1 Predicted dehydrogenase (MviM) (PDB:3UUW) [Commensalibacter communis]CAI3957004.1 Predicted dehydrogenase (MviM) (PDB:3UUW) [Commensalibacter communis]CAI3958794.1 Predicted dehydrogenase (MviM) (PDB:3UUW) [Commensalibacter communis]CAI3959153.1 Predicted dehydrogenase (MviM) (PDB:3UUW) [Commensalibacter communis]